MKTAISESLRAGIQQTVRVISGWTVKTSAKNKDNFLLYFNRLRKTKSKDEAMIWIIILDR